MDTKYLIDGSEVDLISETREGKFVVADLYEDGDGDYIRGEMRIVDHVFDEPPARVYSEQITNLQAEIDQLEEKRFEIRREIEEAREKENPIVAQLRSLLTGKYTHALLCDDSSMEIVNLDKLDRDSNNQNTLILYGSLKWGNWAWKTYSHDYRKSICFCASHEEALAEAQAKINDEFKKRGNVSGQIIRFAMEKGLIVPQKAIDDYKLEQRRSIQREIDFNTKLAREYQESADRHAKRLAELD